MLIGHQRQRDLLASLHQRGHLPHALLFSGPDGIGKTCFALEAAKLLLCEQAASQACHVCPACIQIEKQCRLEKQCHPDLHLVRCEDSETWNSAAYRELLSSLRMRSFTGRARIVIFQDAEYMPTQGANALLKILEEPPAGLYFFLTSSNANALLSTIRSRAQTWRFDRLSDEDVQAVWQQWSPAEVDAIEEHWKNFSCEERLHLADGRPASLFSLQLEYDQFTTMEKLLAELCEGVVPSSQLFAKFLTEDKERTPRLLEVLTVMVQRHMRASQNSLLRYRLAELLADLLELPYFLFERHMQANLAFLVCFAQFASSAALPYPAKSQRFQDLLAAT